METGQYLADLDKSTWSISHILDRGVLSSDVTYTD